MVEARIKHNIKILSKRINISPKMFLEDKIRKRLDISLKDYYEKLNKYYDYIDEKIEEDVLKTARRLFKGR